MEYLFSPRNLKVLESFAMVKTLYAFDFDGTLAPIVNDPEQAKMSDELGSKLSKFKKLVPLAIITGRKVSDVMRRLPFTPTYILGNHGIEGILTNDEVLAVSRIRKLWMEILSEYEASYFEPNQIWVEDKNYSISLHYRNSSDERTAKLLCLKIAALLPDAEISTGNMVVNVLPPIGINKGVAFEKLLNTHKYPFGFYIGDDATDEDVFRTSKPNTFTVRIGYDPRSKAKYYLKSQSEVETLLDHLLKFHAVN